MPFCAANGSENRLHIAAQRAYKALPLAILAHGYRHVAARYFLTFRFWRLSVRSSDFGQSSGGFPFPDPSRRTFGSVASLALSVFAISISATVPAQAAEPPPAQASSPDGTAPASASPNAGLTEIVVIGRRLSEKNKKLDEARDKDLLPKLGATSYSIDQEAIETLPQGKNTPIDKVLLQAPGVSYDSAISNPDFHVRNEYANTQYRINGIQLPDGVSALGPVLETGFIGNLNLLDGTLPAQYGLRTAGVIDLTTKSQFDPGGKLDLYGGSRGTFSPSVEYGGTAGQTQYFFTGRYLQSGQGLENATPAPNPIHDDTTQGKFFGYGSTLIGDSSRLTYMAGGFVGHFQIPDVTGQAPLGDFGPTTLSSILLNERETDQFFFGVVALQTHTDDLDTQFSVFSRYASVHFMPDVNDDLAFNDVASNVTRNSFLNGAQFDGAERLSDEHTLRAGLDVSAERTQVDDLSTVLPLDAAGNPLPAPVTVNDSTSKVGWNVGAYVQDEWKIRPDLTLNTGLRFDQTYQFVSANQFSPRFTAVYKPFDDTSIHAGVSRYFTPPMQAQSTPNNLALFQNTTQQPAIQRDDPVRPERATYFDVGADQKLLPGVSVGLDGFYKRSTDTIDDGQFGQAVVLDQFNYAHGYSYGAEFKVHYYEGGFRAYANFSYEVTMVKDVVSNQYLIGDPVELAYLASHWTYASDAQTISASLGTSYHWHNLLASVDGIYGSGLRAGFANEQHSSGYTQWNAAVAWDFDPQQNQKLLTLRLSVINIFDESYVLRSATGVGEFAPQYGPRRGLFAELTQEF
jgi:outer membrane receptor protein involved in Fe transport